MAFDGDILQIKVFTETHEYGGRAMAAVTKEVNAYLSGYPANLVHSITPQVTQSEEMTRYTVTVVLRS